MDTPEDHPRYKSLLLRHRLEEGLRSGMTTPTGLVAHGRGEAFDYLLGEVTIPSALAATQVAAALLLLAERPVLSVNGNAAALVRDEMVELAKELACPIEINIFHESPERRRLIAAHFAAAGCAVFGEVPDAMLEGLSSARARVDSRGMFRADVVVVSLEDGDRTEALVRGGKRVIAIDLNPLSRTPQTADIAIVDNVDRAYPGLTRAVRELRTHSPSALQAMVDSYNKSATLAAAVAVIRAGVPAGGARE